MGVGTIMKAKKIVLMAWGESKSEVIRQAVEGPVTEFVPASYLQEHSNTIFRLDEASASELTRNKSPWLNDDVEWDNSMLKKAVTQLSGSCKQTDFKTYQQRLQ